MPHDDDFADETGHELSEALQFVLQKFMEIFPDEKAGKPELYEFMVQCIALSITLEDENNHYKALENEALENRRRLN